MDFEWDAAKSARNEAERGLPFELTALFIDGLVIERVDDRRDARKVAISSSNLTHLCVSISICPPSSVPDSAYHTGRPGLAQNVFSGKSRLERRITAIPLTIEPQPI